MCGVNENRAEPNGERSFNDCAEYFHERRITSALQPHGGVLPSNETQEWNGLPSRDMDEAQGEEQSSESSAAASLVCLQRSICS